jgi:SAM-dependent methyltransferase
VGHSYDDLAGVYDFLVADEGLLVPSGSFQAYQPWLRNVPGGEDVLDCACGPGHLAVGLAGAGFAVTATDASAEMVARTARLASEYGVEVVSAQLTWDQLRESGWQDRFAVVFCVGNSLIHAQGRAGRHLALENMAYVLRPGGRLVLTSRNWEMIRRAGSGITVGDQVLARDGRRAVVIYDWSLRDDWEEPHRLDIAVAVLQAQDAVRTTSASFDFWPFRNEDLAADLDAVGLTVETSTYEPDVDQYLVVAQRGH